MATNKSELIRAGLHALMQMNDAELKQMLDGLEKIKTGRPAQQK
jgi:Arc/MetJ-type ribon-helix-helix transcriptional regulator